MWRLLKGFILVWPTNRLSRQTSTSSSEEAEQTSKQLLHSWPSPRSHHAMRRRGSWTARTKVVSHMLVHMFTLLHLMQKCGEQVNARGRKNIDRSKRSPSQPWKSKLWRCSLMFGKSRRVRLTYEVCISLSAVSNHAKWTMRGQSGMWENQESM